LNQGWRESASCSQMTSVVQMVSGSSNDCATRQCKIKHCRI
jgi:hypothetical protein